MFAKKLVNSARARIAGISAILFLYASCAGAQEFKLHAAFAAYPATPPVARALANEDPVYRQLRSIQLSPESITVNGFRMTRDAGIFTFRTGTFYLLQPVNGITTGAVFVGDASFSLTPPTRLERRYLSILAKENELVEQFHEAVFRFTDGTEADIRKAGVRQSGQPSADAERILQSNVQQLRNRLKENLDIRLLQDILSSNPTGVFTAFIKGTIYGGKLIFDIDPQGAVSYTPDPPPLEQAGPRVREFMSLAPEEVALTAWDENHYGIWTSFHLAEEYKHNTASSAEQNNPFTIAGQKLETSIDKNGKLLGVAQTTVTARRDGVRVLPLDLFPTLRVAWVAGEKSEPLPFIQEDENHDGDFAVILPRELKKGEKYSFTVSYAGKHVVSNEGNGNFYPIARENWYPALETLDYCDYDMTFHIPKGLKMEATGKLLHSFDEGKENITEWKSEALQDVAGFNFGEFKSMESRDLGNHYTVETDVNELPPDGMPQYMSTVPMMKKANAEAQVALALYTDYFGEQPYTTVAMTQQRATNYGQSWPGLVFLPLGYFLDSTYRHMLSPQNEHQFFTTVGAHELAHQWWGHMVGFNSYRDQWISEGFAEMSASLFLQAVYGQKSLSDFHEFWAERRRRLTDVNGEGKRAIDVGPVTLGYRLATAKTGVDIPFDLIYPKGAYILHMLRFMMQDSRNKDIDAPFKAMMHDFTQTFAGRSATTEDFKAIVEKHMTPEMDLLHDHRMDWFFNEYVYGTEYPSYRFEHSFSQDSSGATVLTFKLTQSHVSDDFVMLVPIYIELGKGQVARLGRIGIKGNTTLERQVRLPRLPVKPRRAMIAYMDELMANVENK